MIASTRFLINISLTNLARRYLHRDTYQKQKIVHTTELCLRYLLCKNFCTIAHPLLEKFKTNSEEFQQVLLDFNNINMEQCLESYNPNTSTSTCDISYITSNMMQCEDLLDDSTFNLDGNLNPAIPISFEKQCHLVKQKYKAMRKWEKLTKDKLQMTEDTFIIKLLSFNILAQSLMEAHPHMYRKHNPNAMDWEIRKNLLFQEILEANATVICIQEMQEEHLAEFLIPFRELKYDYLYKQRTNNKADGLLLLYRLDQLQLVDHAKVEFYQSNTELLNRDNVGIIAKFALKAHPETEIVVATTHLLFNPRRSDIRLGQIQLLFAEIERIAFVKNTSIGPNYLPIILSGDFNLKPWTSVYKFIMEGSFEYINKSRNLENSNHNVLSNILIPPRLHITDGCQHYNVLKKRLRGDGNGQVMLGNRKNWRRYNEDSEVDLNTMDSQTIEVTDGSKAKFASGTLTHPFKMKSVYQHSKENGELEATTEQDDWITVDYIFYSDVEPLERYSLPTMRQCFQFLRKIPNFVVGSDHLCLGASFKVHKKRSNV